MHKQYIYFVGILFIVFGAISSVPADEIASLSNNASVTVASNISLNETSNATVSEPANMTANETVILEPEAVENQIIDASNDALNQNQTGLNETILENATSEVAKASNVGVAAEISKPAMNQIESRENAVFAIGDDLSSMDVFQIGNDMGSENVYDIGLAPEPVRYLSEIL